MDCPAPSRVARLGEDRSIWELAPSMSAHLRLTVRPRGAAAWTFEDMPRPPTVVIAIVATAAATLECRRDRARAMLTSTRHRPAARNRFRSCFGTSSAQPEHPDAP